MASQLDSQNNLLEDCVNSLKTWKGMIEKHLEGPDKAEELSQLEEVVRDFCLINYNASKSSEACSEVLDYFNDDSNNQDVDVEELYKIVLSRNRQAFSGDYQQKKIWKEVFLGHRDRDCEEVVQGTSQVPADSEFEEMNDSIFYSNVFTPPVDPISKMVIKDPYKNRKCGHIYDYKFIVHYVKSMKSKARCPYMGCTNQNISMGELVQDSETKTKIENFTRLNPNADDSD